MNSHNEKKEYLYFGKTKIDISNVSYGRIVIASEMWEDARNKEIKLTENRNEEERHEHSHGNRRGRQ